MAKPILASHKDINCDVKAEFVDHKSESFSDNTMRPGERHTQTCHLQISSSGQIVDINSTHKEKELPRCKSTFQIPRVDHNYCQIPTLNEMFIELGNDTNVQPAPVMRTQSTVSNIHTSTLDIDQDRNMFRQTSKLRINPSRGAHIKPQQVDHKQPGLILTMQEGVGSQLTPSGIGGTKVIQNLKTSNALSRPAITVDRRNCVETIAHRRERASLLLPTGGATHTKTEALNSIETYSGIPREIKFEIAFVGKSQGGRKVEENKSTCQLEDCVNDVRSNSMLVSCNTSKSPERNDVYNKNSPETGILLGYKPPLEKINEDEILEGIASEMRQSLEDFAEVEGATISPDSGVSCSFQIELEDIEEHEEDECSRSHTAALQSSNCKHYIKLPERINHEEKTVCVTSHTPSSVSSNQNTVENRQDQSEINVLNIPTLQISEAQDGSDTEHDDELGSVESLFGLSQINHKLLAPFAESFGILSPDELDGSGSDTDVLDKLKAETARLNLETRRPSFIAWKEKYVVGKPYLWRHRIAHKTVNSQLPDDFSEERVERVNEAISWLRQELMEMRTKDQELARLLISLRHDIQTVKLQRSTAKYQEMIDDAVEQEEEKRDELSEICDSPPDQFSPMLKQYGVTRMNISRRRFSVF